MKKTLSVILALTLVITFSAAVFGYLNGVDISDNAEYYLCGENGEYIFVSVKFNAPLAEDFPKTGLYTNDENHTPIYTMERKRRFENTYVSRDGKTVAFVPDYDNSVWFDTKCCEIYKEGKLINSLDMVCVFNVFSMEKLMLYVNGTKRNSGGKAYKEWCANQGKDSNDIVTLQILNGRAVFIDLNNGTIFYTPNYFQTAVILLNAIALAAVLIILKIKRCRKASRI